jgi:hypothetical protein
MEASSSSAGAAAPSIDSNSPSKLLGTANENFLMTGGKRVVFYCNNCERDISTQFRIRCADPACVDFDLCSDCFSAGAQIHPHKNTHAYRVVDCLDKPMFTKDWTTNEELMLLEGIEKFGVGNWKVGQHIAYISSICPSLSLYLFPWPQFVPNINITCSSRSPLSKYSDNC